MVDEDSFYPKIEIGYLFTPYKEKELIRQFRNRSFTQFQNQASASLRGSYYNPRSLKIQHLPVKEDLILDAKR